MTNLQKLQTSMKQNGVDALLITELTNVQWVSGFRGSAGVVIATTNDARFISDGRYTIAAAEQVKDMPTFTYQRAMKLDEFIAQHIREMNIHSIGFESENVSYKRWSTLAETLAGIQLVPTPDIISALRMIKTESEIKAIKEACKLADAGFDHILKLIQPGVSEYDLNLELEFFIRRHNAGLAFDPIVVSGANSAMPHGKATEKKLQKGDFLTMDFGANLNGQCSDLTRTVVVGECSERSCEIYNAVLKSQLAAIDAMKPGAKAHDIDAISREAMGELSEFFTHGLGHGLGSVVHDAGRLANNSTDVIEVNQVWTVEPGVYIPDFGGVRIEDDVLITENGAELLTFAPKELLVLP